MTAKREIDEVTGVETTGHVWDGDLKELNKPLPRWWIYTFYVSIVWAIGYWVVYPAWPTTTGYTKGIWNYSQRAVVAADVKAGKDAQSAFRGQLDKTELGDVKKNPELMRFTMAGGSAAFQTNCSPCHGRGAQGFSGYPNLNDDDWIWGGKLEDIQKTISVGIRSDHKDARQNQMPRYGVDNLLDAKQINDAAEYVLSLSGKSTDKAAAERGGQTFKEQCAACHGDDGKGKTKMGEKLGIESLARTKMPKTKMRRTAGATIR